MPDAMMDVVETPDAAAIVADAPGPQPIDPCAPITPEFFRLLIPAMGDPTKFSDALIQTWINMCPINCCVWGTRFQLGQALWTAHEIAKLGPGGLAMNSTGGIGVISSKGVGPVSVSYDNHIGEEPGAGQYNLTIYGRQFWSMLRLLPIGPIQIGAVSVPPQGWVNATIPSAGNAWSGPWPAPTIAGFSS
jgi:hypothetical protein